MPTDLVTPELLVKRYAAEASARIVEADAKAHEAQVAFAAGKFPEYFRQKLEDAKKRIEDEYDQTIGSATSGGDSQAGG